MIRFLKFCGKSFLSVLLCALLVCTAVSPALAASSDAHAPLQVGVISDIHYFAERSTGNWCDAFMRFADGNAYQRYECPALLDSALAALAAHAAENGMRYVLLPGDLTANGEYDNHAELAERLEAFEQETGLSVIVTNGNHDINNYHGFTYASGKKEPARITTPEEFRELYRNLGFDLAYHTYTPKTGKAGMLSYSVRLDGGYRLIVLDVNKYSADITANGTDRNQTEGCITSGLLEWALEEIADAKRNGEAVIGMEHHGIVEHFTLESSLFKAFLVDSWRERAEALADAGLSVMLTGHMHDTSITEWVTDKGNVIYDVSTTSLTGFPNTFREIRFDNSGEHLTADVQTFDVDCVKPVTVRGKTFEQPYSVTYSFAKSYDGDGIASLALRFLSGPLDSFFGALETQGTILGALREAFGLDVAQLVSQYVNVHLGQIDLFTAKNVMSFLDDLDTQIRTEILTSRADAEELVRVTIQKLMDLQVSDLPCTRYIERYGFGDPNRPGTFEEAGYSALAILYEANQSVEDDPFMQDVLDFFRNRGGAEQLLAAIYDILVNDLLQDTVLGNLQVRIDTLFPSGTIGHIGAAMLDNFLTILFRGDKSYTNVINGFLKLGLVPDFNSINTAADYFLGEYMTDSAVDALGVTLADMIEDLITDHGDGEDLNRTLTAAPRAVEATRENFRLPSVVTMSVGEDAAHERYFSWYTRSSVTGCDIEIVPYSENPYFTGKPTTSGIIRTAKNRQEYLLYPGVDLGFTGFFKGNYPLMHHTLRIDGLESGRKYSYRVGDAKKGWWSDAGVIDMTQADDTASFLHVTDAASFNAAQYAQVHRVLQTATAMYPQTDAILSSGNQVYDGSNLHQWQAFADTSADVLMRVPFMPAVGTAESANVLPRYFTLPGLQEDVAYYDFDLNGVHFMVLDTNDASEKNGLSAEQLAWLQNSAKASGEAWKVVVLHKAVYAGGEHNGDKEVAAMRRQFASLFPSLGIDLVFEGQDRIYARTDALVNGVPMKTRSRTVSFGGKDYAMRTGGKGTYYVLSGATGAEPAGSVEKTGVALCGAVRKETTLPVFSAVQVQGGRLYFDAYTVDADGRTERIDSFALDKSSKGKSSDAQTEELSLSDGAASAQVEAAMDVFEIDLPGEELEGLTDENGNPYTETEPSVTKPDTSSTKPSGPESSSTTTTKPTTTKPTTTNSSSGKTTTKPSSGKTTTTKPSSGKTTTTTGSYSGGGTANTTAPRNGTTTTKPASGGSAATTKSGSGIKAATTAKPTSGGKTTTAAANAAPGGKTTAPQSAANGSGAGTTAKSVLPGGGAETAEQPVAGMTEPGVIGGEGRTDGIEAGTYASSPVSDTQTDGTESDGAEEEAPQQTSRAGKIASIIVVAAAIVAACAGLVVILRRKTKG